MGRLRPLALVLLFASFCPGLAGAQYFGQNKVQYDRFDWSTIETEHFDVYFYEGERDAALDAARMAERSYRELADLFSHEPRERIPLILYASHTDFQQTNITSSLIGDGTGGLTELLRRRVVVPFTGSYAELDHVLKHELVHVFQIDILYGASGEAMRNLFLFQPPLWFIEGMAEYLSLGGLDAQTEMWLSDAAMEGRLTTLDQLGQVADIRVYRFGQGVWEFIARKYGVERIGETMHQLAMTRDLDLAFRQTLGIGLQRLSEKWISDIRRRYLPQVAGLEDPGDAGNRLTSHLADYSQYNVAGAISPEGDEYVYISDRSMYSDIYLASTVDSRYEVKLVSGERSPDFESLRFFHTSIAWSPDASVIAFPAKIGAEDAIYVMDVRTRRIERRLTFGLDGLLSPTWSPEGDRLAFAGLDHGRSDLYVVDRDGSNLRKLTDDRYTVRDPAWSPNGTTIVFVTDRGPDTDVDALTFGQSRLALYDLPTGTIELIGGQEGMNYSPQWSPDGTKIGFVSDRNGISNIFVFDLIDHRLYQVTNLSTGVCGIAQGSPAMSWARERDRMLFSAFKRGGWDIYVVERPLDRMVAVANESTEETEPADETGTDNAIAPSEPFTGELAEGPGQANTSDENSGSRYGLPDTTSFAIRGYKVRFSPDMSATGAMYSSNVGIAGNTSVAFSDVLGNHTLFGAASIYGSLSQSDILIGYLNRQHRTNWSIALYQFRNDFLLFVAEEEAGFESQIYRGGQVMLSRPFDRFRRIELGLDAMSINRAVFRQSYYSGQSETSSKGTLYFASPFVAFVADNVLFGSTGPIDGMRARLSVEHAVGDLSYSSATIDARKYFNIRHRYVAAIRAVSGASRGRDPQLYRIGGATTLRGLGYGELTGTNAFMLNTEFRFPLIERLKMGWPLPLHLRNVRGSLFFDIGGAWHADQFRPFTTDGPGVLRIEDAFAAYGFGARLNVGFLILKYDLAQPTDLVSHTEKMRHYFSIGSEF